MGIPEAAEQLLHKLEDILFILNQHQHEDEGKVTLDYSVN